MRKKIIIQKPNDKHERSYYLVQTHTLYIIILYYIICLSLKHFPRDVNLGFLNRILSNNNKREKKNK